MAMGTAEPIREPGRHELEMIRREQVEMLHEELARLPEKYRLAIVLCDLAGLTHAEAAGRLCWPSGSLSVRLMRARELLRDRLTRRGLAPASALLATSALAETASAAVPQDLAAATVNAALTTSVWEGTRRRPEAARLRCRRCRGSVLTAMTRAQVVVAALMAMVGVSGLIAIVLSVLIVNTQGRADSPGGPRSISSAVARPEDPTPDRRRLRAGADTAEALDDDDTAHFGRLCGCHTAGALGNSLSIRRPLMRCRAYQALVKNAGRDAGAQVRLALWCEANGLFPERLKHLSLAVLTDPDHPTARGLLGQVFFRGRWRRPEDIVRCWPVIPASRRPIRVCRPARPDEEQRRRPLAAGTMVRAGGPGDRGGGSRRGGHAARAFPGGCLAAAGLRGASRPLAAARANRRRGRGGRGPEEGRSLLETLAGEVEVGTRTPRRLETPIGRSLPGERDRSPGGAGDPCHVCSGRARRSDRCGPIARPGRRAGILARAGAAGGFR